MEAVDLKVVSRVLLENMTILRITRFICECISLPQYHITAYCQHLAKMQAVETRRQSAILGTLYDIFANLRGGEKI